MTALTWRNLTPASKRGGTSFLCLRGNGASVGNDFDAEAAGARAVEFAEENSLPAAELELACADENRGAAADERRLDVRIGVAFDVAVAGVLGDKAREGDLDIGGDGRVITFVDEHGGGGVRDIDVTDAALYAGVLHHFGYAGSDVEQLRAALGAHGDFAGGGVAGCFGGAWRHRGLLLQGLKSRKFGII